MRNEQAVRFRRTPARFPIFALNRQESMPTSQAAILAPSVTQHYFLEFTAGGEGHPGDLIRALCEVLETLRKREEIQAVMGFGSALYRTLAPGALPSPLAPFPTLQGRGGKCVPSTQNDLWLWLSGMARDRVFSAALETHRRLGAAATLRMDQPAFTYLDSRDLTGFIDGTANPQGDDARAAALIPEDAPGAGGSHVLAMRWIHNLPAFHALAVSEQEKVIGRTKPDSVELRDPDKPETSHISRVEVDVGGEEAVIFRRSVPFGTVSEHGLYFLGFSADPSRFMLMLKRMYGLTEDGLEDRLTDFSRPTHSAFYYAPSEEALREVLRMR
jgi:putative iron-dependent peroxidase